MKLLTILIPTYNYNIFPLVERLQLQCKKCGIAYEIIVLDDASKLFHEENNRVNLLENCSYTILEKNIGRSKIRNLLAEKSRYDWLLYLDADVFPKEENFIATYLPHIGNTEKAVNGGILYQEKKPDRQRLFRWIYGKKRESRPADLRRKNPYLSFLTLNFLIHKNIIRRVPFNENIPNLRHEDSLFSYDLKQNRIVVEHIENPVYHLGLDVFEVAIRKENESLAALQHLLGERLLAPDYIRIGKFYTAISKYGLCPVFALTDQIFRKIFLANLSGSRPSLYVFDLYRLGYLCNKKGKF